MLHWINKGDIMASSLVQLCPRVKLQSKMCKDIFTPVWPTGDVLLADYLGRSALRRMLKLTDAARLRIQEALQKGPVWQQLQKDTCQSCMLYTAIDLSGLSVKEALRQRGQSKQGGTDNTVTLGLCQGFTRTLEKGNSGEGMGGLNKSIWNNQVCLKIIILLNYGWDFIGGRI